MVLTVLHRPNANAIGTFWVRLPEESGSPPASYAMTLANEKER
jgi:hypothetical protein